MNLYEDIIFKVVYLWLWLILRHGWWLLDTDDVSFCVTQIVLQKERNPEGDVCV